MFCIASQVHTHAIFFIYPFEREYYWNRKYFLNNIFSTLLKFLSVIIFPPPISCNEFLQQCSLSLSIPLQMICAKIFHLTYIFSRVFSFHNYFFSFDFLPWFFSTYSCIIHSRLIKPSLYFCIACIKFILKLYQSLSLRW